MSSGQQNSNGTISIHGREYKTVALRVQEFRESFPLSSGWSLRSEIISLDADKVVMRALVVSPDDKIVATGYAEEYRNASKINATSALENCETSALGRALAACGYGGSEYASANEVQGAIASQEIMIAERVTAALDAITKSDWLACCQMDKGDDALWLEAWKKLGSKDRARFKELQAIRDKFRMQLDALAAEHDDSGFRQVNDELSVDQARYIFVLITPDAQMMMTQQRTKAA